MVFIATSTLFQLYRGIMTFNVVLDILIKNDNISNISVRQPFMRLLYHQC